MSEQVENVPKSEVPRVVRSFIEDGMTRITVTKNDSNGRWNIRASSPES
jgi:hypothetical protein